MQNLIKNKDFIIGVALLGNSPQNDNIYLKEVFESYNSIDSTVEVLAECSTCQKPYEKPFKIILAYCESKNWFENDTTSNSKNTTNKTKRV